MQVDLWDLFGDPSFGSSPEKSNKPNKRPEVKTLELKDMSEECRKGRHRPFHYETKWVGRQIIDNMGNLRNQVRHFVAFCTCVECGNDMQFIVDDPNNSRKGGI